MADAVTQLIDAAERLAAQQGLAALSVRAVQVAAGQRNKSAVSYHFGSKEGLVEAVVARRMGTAGERRRALLDELGPAASRRGLVEALVVPLAEHVTAGSQPSYWARFLLQAAYDPDFSRSVRLSFEAGTFREVRDRLVAGLDHVPVELRERRFEHAIGLVISSLATYEAGHVSVDLAPEVLTADLIDMAVGVLDAHMSSATAAAFTSVATAGVTVNRVS